MTSTKLIPFRIKEADAKCERCPLSTGKAIFGHSFVPLSQVKLIIVSAYPGQEEVKSGLTLTPNERRPKLDSMNAGRFLRASLTNIFDTDKDFPNRYKPFYKFCMYTNMIKCSPMVKKEKKEIKASYITTCKSWLDVELQEVSKYNPRVPILLAGSEAVKLLGKDETLYTNRRQVHYYGQHPVIITFNPIEPARYAMKVLAEYRDMRDGSIKIEDTAFWKPIPLGEMRWHWMKDLELTKQVVKEVFNV